VRGNPWEQNNEKKNYEQKSARCNISERCADRRLTIQSKEFPATALNGGKLKIDPMPPGCIYLYLLSLSFCQTSK